MASKCTDHKSKIAGIPVTDFYNNCPDDFTEYGDMITIGDPGDKFMIRLPYSWDIQESYTDTLYGIIASNRFDAGNDPKKFVLLSVTGYQTIDSLYPYFLNEIKSLKKDKTMKVLELGTMEINEKETYWVKFESEETDFQIMNLVQYVQSNQEDAIYILQSSVYKSENYNEALCRLKRFTDSFELVE
jgi:hypothetical protein